MNLADNSTLLKTSMKNLTLVESVSNGNRGLTKNLLAAGADYQVRTEAGVPLLYLAIQKGLDELISLLIGAGAQIEPELFIDVLIHFDDEMVASFLLLNRVHECLPVAKMSALYFWAAERSRILSVSSILASGIDINFKDTQGYTALHKAVLASGDNSTIVEFLTLLEPMPRFVVDRNET